MYTVSRWCFCYCCRCFFFFFLLLLLRCCFCYLSRLYLASSDNCKCLVFVLSCPFPHVPISVEGTNRRLYRARQFSSYKYNGILKVSTISSFHLLSGRSLSSLPANLNVNGFVCVCVCVWFGCSLVSLSGIIINRLIICFYKLNLKRKAMYQFESHRARP